MSIALCGGFTLYCIVMANRSLNALKWNFKIKAKAFMADSRIKNKIFVTETLRSVSRQRELVAKWLSKTMNSNHITGNAFDIAFKWSTLYPRDQTVWREIADIAKEYKIDRWYDLWKWDKPHFQNNDKTYIKKKVRYNAKTCFTRKADLSKKDIQYDQTKNRCRLYSNITALSHARGIEFDNRELEWINHYAEYMYNRETGKWNNPFIWAEIMLAYMEEFYPEEKIIARTDNLLKSRRLVKSFLKWNSVVIMKPWHATCAYFDYEEKEVVNVDSYESRKNNVKDIDNFYDKIKNGEIEDYVIMYEKR